MSWIDWLIVVLPVSAILWLALYAKRYARDAVDFLAAGRVAGRYVMSVGDMANNLSVIVLVMGVETRYHVGYGIVFWSSLTVPLGIIMGLTGYCTYRWRETRCLTKGQFIEMRYGSKALRATSAVISALSEMIYNAMSPAIATNFFIYYMGLPHRVTLFGHTFPTYHLIVLLCLAMALFIILPAGRISLLITDCCQGLLSYPIFVIIVIFILIHFNWDQDVAPLLADRVANQSFLNPYDISEFRDFNLFMVLSDILARIMRRASWFGNDNSNVGRTPHEQKMSGILGSMRDGFSSLMTLSLAILLIVFMNSPRFATNSKENQFALSSNQVRHELAKSVLDAVVTDPASKERAARQVAAIPDLIHIVSTEPLPPEAERLPGVVYHHRPLAQSSNTPVAIETAPVPPEEALSLDEVYFSTVRTALGDTPQARNDFQQFKTIFYQMMMPFVMGRIFPKGLLGFFCLLMVMLLISTDDSRIFNAAGVLFQDIVIPYSRKPLSPERHIFLIRVFCVLVAVFFLVCALFMVQLDYIQMLLAILSATWTAGSGPVMVFGLYTRFGNIYGAWSSVIVGCGSSILVFFAQRLWPKHIYPWIDSHPGWVDALDKLLRKASAPFDPWIRWSMSPLRFPINSYEVMFLATISAILVYIVASLLTYRQFDLDKLLHRGKWSDGHEAPRRPFSFRHILNYLVSITPDYTLGDKIITWFAFLHSIVYGFLLIFIGVIVWNSISPWTIRMWQNYFFYRFLIIPSFFAAIFTVWFLIGGVRDARQLFIDLAKRKRDEQDNGRVPDDARDGK